VNRRLQTAKDLLDELDPVLLDAERRRAYIALRRRLGEQQVRLARLPSARERILKRWPLARVTESDQGLAVNLVAHGEAVTDLGEVAGDELIALSIGYRGLPDLVDLARCPRLQNLSLGAGGPRSLEPLAGLPLEALFCQSTVASLAPLANAPLGSLTCQLDADTDLALLSDFRLRKLTISGFDGPIPTLDTSRLARIGFQTAFPLDLSILAGATLYECILGGMAELDLEPLRGVTLRAAHLGPLAFDDFGPFPEEMIWLGLHGLAPARFRDGSLGLNRLVVGSNDLDFGAVEMPGLQALVFTGTGLRPPHAWWRSPPKVLLAATPRVVPDWLREHLPVLADRSEDPHARLRYRALQAWADGQRRELVELAVALPDGRRVLPVPVQCSHAEAEELALACAACLVDAHESNVRTVIAELAGHGCWTAGVADHQGVIHWPSGNTEPAPLTDLRVTAGPVLMDHMGMLAVGDRCMSVVLEWPAV
jgi:hypothetical protein